MKNIKSSKRKAKSNIQGKTHTITSRSSNRNSAGQKGMAGYLESTQRQKSTTKITISGKDLIQFMENQMLYRQAEVERIRHHQTSLATNTDGAYIASKHKRKERPTKANPKQ